MWKQIKYYFVSDDFFHIVNIVNSNTLPKLIYRYGNFIDSNNFETGDNVFPNMSDFFTLFKKTLMSPFPHLLYCTFMTLTKGFQPFKI